MLICTNCNKEYKNGKFCKACGGTLVEKSTVVTCPSCGAVISDDSIFCSECGAKITAEKPKKKRASTVDKKLFNDIRQCIAYTLDISVDEVSKTTSFCNDLAVDSLDACEIAYCIENEIGASIPEAKLVDFKTVKDACIFIQKQLEEQHLSSFTGQMKAYLAQLHIENEKKRKNMRKKAKINEKLKDVENASSDTQQQNPLTMQEQEALRTSENLCEKLAFLPKFVRESISVATFALSGSSYSVASNRMNAHNAKVKELESKCKNLENQRKQVNENLTDNIDVARTCVEKIMALRY